MVHHCVCTQVTQCLTFAYTESERVSVSAQLLHEPDLQQSDELLLLGLRGRVHLDTLLEIHVHVTVVKNA